MSAPYPLLSRALLFSGLACLVLPAAGCVGLAAQLLYMVNGGDKVKPEFTGLKGKKVAVVCVAANSSTGPSSVAGQLERSVGLLLTQKGDKIDVIPSDKVADWIDRNDWNQVDYKEIGLGVKANMVLAIDLDGVRLHEGKTLYKGRASVVVTVYDMTDDGKVVFRRDLTDFSFPKNGARHSTEMSEARFQRLFVEVLAQQVGKYFYSYRREENFANDALLLDG